MPTLMRSGPKGGVEGLPAPKGIRVADPVVNRISSKLDDRVSYPNYSRVSDPRYNRVSWSRCPTCNQGHLGTKLRSPRFRWERSRLSLKGAITMEKDKKKEDLNPKMLSVAYLSSLGKTQDEI